ncbi:MAG: hypothetical protein M3O61_14705 [Gemmatimonadota bacterium]|nr:hypothetical protein [Gemmatimonadota bacterium]
MTTPGQAADTSYVEYRDSPISLPQGIGVRVPMYNRVDGLVIPWGPLISLANDRIRIDPTVTYRSHIGKFDPFVRVQIAPMAATRIEIAGGRGTFTNDGWIRSDLVNSLAALAVGSDARNYFRADRGWATVARDFVANDIVFTPSIGAQTENDWSTGSPVRHTNAPWSLLNESDSLKMRRPNPAIVEGHVSSILGRLKTDYEREDVKANLDVGVEHAFDAPPNSFMTEELVLKENLSGDFTQITVGSKASFLTFGEQSFAFRGHAVFTPGDIAPPQRFAYLGGAGTLATVDLLALGGDRLVFVEGEYSIPIPGVQLPLVGNPIVSLRYAAGSAGVAGLPDLIQNLGVGAGVRFFKVEYHFDPNYKETSFTHKTAFSVGLSLSL